MAATSSTITSVVPPATEPSMKRVKRQRAARRRQRRMIYAFTYSYKEPELVEKGKQLFGDTVSWGRGLSENIDANLFRLLLSPIATDGHGLRWWQFLCLLADNFSFPSIQSLSGFRSRVDWTTFLFVGGTSNSPWYRFLAFLNHA